MPVSCRLAPGYRPWLKPMIGIHFAGFTPCVSVCLKCNILGKGTQKLRESGGFKKLFSYFCGSKISAMMNKNRPLILVSNDDGFDSNGIRSLVSFIADMGEVLVCAPDSPRSGYSCAFTAADPLYLKRREDIAGAEVWSCSGTPVDSVKLAIDQILDNRMPELILGGINHGDNSTVNNHYSGTMGVAYEGAMKYIPSIAFSSCDFNPEADLSPLRPYVRQIVTKVLTEGLPKGTCLNVNFPKGNSFKGIKVCRMTYGRWVNEVESRQHPYGGGYYWMVGHYENDEPEETDTDQWAIAHGYVAVTPTTIDVTDYGLLGKLKF